MPDFLTRQYSLFCLRQNFTNNTKTWLTVKLGSAVLHYRWNLCRWVFSSHPSQTTKQNKTLFRYYNFLNLGRESEHRINK